MKKMNGYIKQFLYGILLFYGIALFTVISWIIVMTFSEGTTTKKITVSAVIILAIVVFARYGIPYIKPKIKAKDIKDIKRILSLSVTMAEGGKTQRNLKNSPVLEEMSKEWKGLDPKERRNKYMENFLFFLGFIIGLFSCFASLMIIDKVYGLF